MVEQLPRLSRANAQFVTDRLLVGGDLSESDDRAREQLAELVQVGLTHVVDCRIEANDVDFVAREAPEVAYLHIGMDDAGQEVPDVWFEEVTSFALDALSDPRGIVLTHCYMGINRGPSAGFAVLLALGWDPVAALEAIYAARPAAYIAYAEDAVGWHHRRLGSVDRLATDLGRVARWREDNRLDLDNAIRLARIAKRGS
jgi:dual specificity phosphatase 3